MHKVPDDFLRAGAPLHTTSALFTIFAPAPQHPESATVLQGTLPCFNKWKGTLEGTSPNFVHL